MATGGKLPQVVLDFSVWGHSGWILPFQLLNTRPRLPLAPFPGQAPPVHTAVPHVAGSKSPSLSPTSLLASLDISPRRAFHCDIIPWHGLS